MTAISVLDHLAHGDGIHQTGRLDGVHRGPEFVWDRVEQRIDPHPL